MTNELDKTPALPNNRRIQFPTNDEEEDGFGVGEEDAEFYPEESSHRSSRSGEKTSRRTSNYDARDKINRKKDRERDDYYTSRDHSSRREGSRGEHRESYRSERDRYRDRDRDRDRESHRKSEKDYYRNSSAVEIPDSSNSHKYDRTRYDSGGTKTTTKTSEEDRKIEERLRQIDLELNKRGNIKEEYKENKDPSRRRRGRGMGLKSPPREGRRRSRRKNNKDDDYSSSSRSRSRSSDSGNETKKRGKKIFADAPTALMEKNKKGHRGIIFSSDPRSTEPKKPSIAKFTSEADDLLAEMEARKRKEQKTGKTIEFDPHDKDERRKANVYARDWDRYKKDQKQKEFENFKKFEQEMNKAFGVKKEEMAGKEKDKENEKESGEESSSTSENEDGRDRYNEKEKEAREKSNSKEGSRSRNNSESGSKSGDSKKSDYVAWFCKNFAQVFLFTIFKNVECPKTTPFPPFLHLRHRILRRRRRQLQTPRRSRRPRQRIPHLPRQTKLQRPRSTRPRRPRPKSYRRRRKNDLGLPTRRFWQRSRF